MNVHTYTLDIRDEPDVLVRIIQIMHRQGGHIRSLTVETGGRWAHVHIAVEGITKPGLVTQKLEKLVDVGRAHITAQQ